MKQGAAPHLFIITDLKLLIKSDYGTVWFFSVTVFVVWRHTALIIRI